MIGPLCRFLRRRLSRRKPAVGHVPPWPLSMPLLTWGPKDAWTLGDAVQGTCVLGATGSGKTSSSGALIAREFLLAGMGGLVLAAKPGEAETWRRYCRAAGREQDLVVFGEREKSRFSFLDYELTRGGRGSGLTENIVNLWSTVLEVASRGGSGSGGGREDEGYWRRSCRHLVRNCIEILRIATGHVSIPDLYRLIVSAPTSPDLVRSDTWQANSYCYQLLAAADKKPKAAQEQRDLHLATTYMLGEYPALSDRTRSVIVSTCTSLIDVLNRGVLYELFSTTTNVTPEATQEGKIIVVDLPVKEYLEVGVIAALLWKLAFQRFAEQRAADDTTRPLFLWCDEAQHWLVAQDAMFQSTCRSSRVATMLITQTLSGMEAALGGGEKGKAETAMLVANLVTKVLHSSGDPATNQWASSLIGRTRQHMASGNNTQQAGDWVAAAMGLGSVGQTSGGYSEAYEWEVQPSSFSELRTGGHQHDHNVDAIVFQSGRRFAATGRTWMPVTFRQE